MAKMTLSVSDDLYKRIEQHGIQKTSDSVNWSKLFQDAVERFFEIEERAIDTDIPLDIIQKVIEELAFDSEKLSLEFGKDIFIEWIKKSGNTKHLFSISQTDETYVELYNKFGNIIGPIEEYEKSFKDAILDRDMFAKGFVSTAKVMVNTIKKIGR